MARIRTIKPEFWTDETLVELPYEYRLLFIGLWNFVDDEGFIEYRTKQIKMKVFPGDDVNVSTGIQALKKRSLIDSYDLTIEGETVKVLRVSNWKRHQVINRPGKSLYADAYQERYDDEGNLREHSVSAHGGLTREGKGKEGSGKERKGDSQVGGGGHLSRDADPAAADLAEPWRCMDHQGVDVPCHGCKAAKAAHKKREEERANAGKTSAEDERKAKIRATHAAIQACDRCDAKGYLTNGRTCHHPDQQQED